jgi:hypothetical protein
MKEFVEKHRVKIFEEMENCEKEMLHFVTDEDEAKRIRRFLIFLKELNDDCLKAQDQIFHEQMKHEQNRIVELNSEKETEEKTNCTSPLTKEENIEVKTFKSDFRNSNPKLHLLYTKWAIQHLSEIDKMLKKLFGFSNINMLDVGWALKEQVVKLINENAAYAEAQEILDSISGEDEES